MIFANMFYLGIVADQEQLWAETLADDTATEEDVQRGGLTLTNIDPRLYHDIQVQLSRLIGKAEQLIGNVTTNLAESWTHIRTKFDGGKVNNRCQSGTWEHRCMGAGLRQNMGREWSLHALKDMTKSSPNQVFINAIERSAKILANDQKRKATEAVKEQR